MRTRDIKARAEMYVEDYDEEMIDDLNYMLSGYINGKEAEDIDSTEIYEIVEHWNMKRPEPWDWAYDKVTSELDDIGDQKYQAMKDEGR